MFETIAVLTTLILAVVFVVLFGAIYGICFMVTYGGKRCPSDSVFLGVTILALAGFTLRLRAVLLEKSFSRWRP